MTATYDADISREPEDESDRLAGLTTIRDLIDWAVDQGLWQETTVDGTLVNAAYLLEWAHQIGRYEEITLDHLSGLYHVCTGL